MIFNEDIKATNYQIDTYKNKIYLYGIAMTSKEKNLVLVTHYVVISEALDYAPSSGEIVIADINFKKIDNIEINY